jgi:hypothetical protein
MARPKKTQSGVEDSDNSQGDNSEVEVNEISEIMKLVLELKKEIQELKQNKDESKYLEKSIKEESFDNYEDEFDEIDIRPDSYVKVISLTPYMLNLTTETSGRGKVFTFPSFGVTKRILYSDLVNILEVNQSFLNEGLFYIADRRIIRKNGLDSIYEKLLTKEKIEAIVSGKSNDAVSLYKSANNNQKEFIVDMLISKLANDPDSVDLNLIDKISRASGIKIQEKAEETREFAESLKANK